jgi:hypothetical protein
MSIQKKCSYTYYILSAEGNYSPIKSIHMSYDCFYSIYDQDGRYVGFTDTLEEAKLMAIEYNGHYELEFVSSNSVFS